jgi:hypothetical protein
MALLRRLPILLMNSYCALLEREVQLRLVAAVIEQDET